MYRKTIKQVAEEVALSMASTLKRTSIWRFRKRDAFFLVPISFACVKDIEHSKINVNDFLSFINKPANLPANVARVYLEGGTLLVAEAHY